MHIAVLGTGHMATTLADGFLAAGHTVTFGSRDPVAHGDLAAPVTATKEAIRGADLVVNALQAAFSLETLTPLASELAGAVLLDIGNAVTPEFALMYPNDSLGARLQAALPETRVVKSLNTLPGTLAIAPKTVAEPTSVFLSGDDADAKALVSGLLADLGWPATQQIDLGGIESARGAEHYFLLFVAMMQAFRGQAFNIRVVH
ncbi:NAD(P)-binding domain-containing protein [Herbiconiux sp. CPCC 205763]|uniref:NAD(P)-binding domain-containing protein n=1 Tax=Herbiconiux aconitum TaxID=2970913 RepID=A0ABT2GN52_9MICO|nr:NAD(P)-binding domain-containing protein [Herbiconiux aconitum]MCS5717658.1 NAD(P)-binding domain-containing protein [Herbiconiux aconitum]